MFVTAAIVFIVISFIYHSKTGDGIWYATNNISRDRCHELAEEHNKELASKYKSSKLVHWCIIAFICIGSINALIPSQKDAMLIYILPKVANHSSIEEWNKVLNDMPKAIQDLLEEYIPKETKE